MKSTENKVTIGTIVQIDRSVRPNYPDWGKVVHPELENFGPTEYDLTEIEMFLHPTQKIKPIKGHVIYQHLQETGELKNCLGLGDAEKIRQKGTEMFLKFFEVTEIFCYRSVVKTTTSLLVPYLLCFDGRVSIRWDVLDQDYGYSFPAGHFK